MTDYSLIPASEITPESVYRRRRELIGLGLASPLLAVAGCSEAKAPIAANTGRTGANGFSTSDILTSYRDITSYNNFYEFGTDKSDPARNAHSLRTKPWTVVIGG